MCELTLNCPAKINLFLEVLGKRADGYHEVLTVMQTIGLYDRLIFRLRKSGISISCGNPSVPLDETNLVHKAAQLLQKECGIRKGVEIEIEKRIPVAAGLGGASSDAAAALLALNKLWGLRLNKNKLLAFSGEIGTDTVLFIHLAGRELQSFSGGTVLGRGRGDELENLPSIGKTWVVIAVAPFGILTANAYRTLGLGLTSDSKNFIMLPEAFKSADIRVISGVLFNRFEGFAVAQHSEIGDIKGKLVKEGADGVCMSGTGPAIYGLFSSAEKAKKAARAVITGEGRNVYVTTTL